MPSARKEWIIGGTQVWLNKINVTSLNVGINNDANIELLTLDGGAHGRLPPVARLLPRSPPLCFFLVPGSGLLGLSGSLSPVMSQVQRDGFGMDGGEPASGGYG